MLNFYVDREECKKSEAEGSPELLAAEALSVLRSLYRSMREEDEEAAKEFRNYIESAFEEGIVFISTKKLKERVLKELEKFIKECMKDDSEDESED